LAAAVFLDDADLALFDEALFEAGPELLVDFFGDEGGDDFEGLFADREVGAPSDFCLAARTSARTSSSLRIERHPETPNFEANFPRSLTVWDLSEDAVYKCIPSAEQRNCDAQAAQLGCVVVPDGWGGHEAHSAACPYTTEVQVLRRREFLWTLDLAMNVVFDGLPSTFVGDPPKTVVILAKKARVTVCSHWMCVLQAEVTTGLAGGTRVQPILVKKT